MKIVIVSKTINRVEVDVKSIINKRKKSEHKYGTSVNTSIHCGRLRLDPIDSHLDDSFAEDTCNSRL